jgi:hypothetical protein
VGFPIRKSADQSFLAAPHGLSQRSTSFIASQRQGIHRMPLRHLIALIIQCPSRSARLRSSVTADFRLRRTVRPADIELERPACFEISSDGPCGQAKADKTPPRRPPCGEPHERCWRMRNHARRILVAHESSERSPLHDVRKPAAAVMTTRSANSDYFRTSRYIPDWWSQTGSNRRPPACKAGALPTELWPRTKRRQVMRAGSSPICLRSRRSGGPGKI